MDLSDYDDLICDKPTQYFENVSILKFGVYNKSDESVYLHHYSKPSPTLPAKFKSERINSNILCRDVELCDKFNKNIINIIKFIENNYNIRIIDMKTEFTVDVDNNVWISHFISAQTITLKKIQNDESVTKLPSITSSYNQSNVAIKCRGDFCDIDANSCLPGIYYLFIGILLLDSTVIKKPEEKKPKKKKKDEEKVDVEKEEPEDDSIKYSTDDLLNDNLPKDMIYKSVLLARSEKKFLYIDSKVTDLDGFGNDWKKYDDELQVKMKSSNPSQYYKRVSVCPNCYRIYEEIQKLRDNNFKPLFPKKTMDVEEKTVEVIEDQPPPETVMEKKEKEILQYYSTPIDSPVKVNVNKNQDGNNSVISDSEYDEIIESIEMKSRRQSRMKESRANREVFNII